MAKTSENKIENKNRDNKQSGKFVKGSVDKIESQNKSEDLNLEQYKIIVDIFKGYLDTALTGTIWAYAVTGAVVTYYLGHKKDDDSLIISLILPFLLCAILAYLAYKGMSQANLLKAQVNTIGEKAGIPTDILEKEGVPPVKILVGFLKAICCLSLIICGGILYIFIKDFLK